MSQVRKLSGSAVMGVKNGGKKHHGRSDDADGLTHIAQEYAQEYEHPGQAGSDQQQVVVTFHINRVVGECFARNPAR